MMGLLSRKKTNTAQSSQPAQAPPPISAPLPSSQPQPPSISTTDYSAKKYPSSTGSAGAYAAQQQPSPPRSPVEAGYAHHGKQQSQSHSYRPQSSNSQNRAGGGGGGGYGAGAGGGQDYGYGANGSSYAQERGYGDVEGKMGNLGINGGAAAGSADQMSVDTDMADGSNGQYGGNGGVYQQQQQSAVSRHHQQQQGGGEVDLSEYGSSGPDPHGHLFPLF
ncbi:hypothetical protein OF846_000162 [Rhodotorula toruloides]|nr:hypothetical protein OF846_000162 [Rhodotorula toruloides]